MTIKGYGAHFIAVTPCPVSTSRKKASLSTCLFRLFFVFCALVVFDPFEKRFDFLVKAAPYAKKNAKRRSDANKTQHFKECSYRRTEGLPQ